MGEAFADKYRRSFLKERGRSRPRLGLVLLVLGLPGPGWARRSKRRSQGSGVARPRSGRGALTAAPFGASCSRAGRSKGALCCFRVSGTKWSSASSAAGCPGAGQADGAAGHSFAAVCGMKRVRRETVGRDQSKGATSPDSGVMTCAIRADRETVCSRRAGCAVQGAHVVVAQCVKTSSSCFRAAATAPMLRLPRR